VNVSIGKNYETLWERHISGYDHHGCSYELFTDVVPGDRIYFSINENKTPEFDGTFFDPGIYVRAGTAPVAPPRASGPTPPENPVFVGEVAQYLDYPGMGIEVHVFGADGSPVPGARVHTHAYSIDFWDATDANGAFRRDGFTHDCEWDVTLEAANPVTLTVKFEINKLVVVNFRTQP